MTEKSPEQIEAEKAAAQQAAKDAAEKAAKDAADKTAAEKAAKEAADKTAAEKAKAGDVTAQMELVNALREELAGTRAQLASIQKAHETATEAAKAATAAKMRTAAVNAGLSKEAFLSLAPADLLLKDPDTKEGKEALQAFRTSFPECFGKPATAGDAAAHGKATQPAATATTQPPAVVGIPKSWASQFADRFRITTR